MNNSKVIYFLGAGASKNACMPICKDIGNPNYYDFIKRTYGGIPAVGLENLDEMCIEIQNLKHSFEEHLAYSHQANNDLYLKLIRFYEATLNAGESTGGLCINPNTGLVYASYYRTFADILSLKTFNSTVISFNHDLWVEHSLLWNNFHYGTISENSWGFNFVNEYRKDYAYLNQENPITLLKLHGSFNYLLCEKCNCLAIGMDYLWLLYPVFKCPVCEGSIFPYYVPPLKDKAVSKFECIWDDAAKKLQETDYLIVSGYSLPEYDYASKDLIENNLNKNAEVIIVDKYAKEISQRYRFIKNKWLLYVEMEFEQAVNSIANGTFTNSLKNVRDI